jgi:hypothetical protein
MGIQKPPIIDLVKIVPPHKYETLLKQMLRVPKSTPSPQGKTLSLESEFERWMLETIKQMTKMTSKN